MASFPFPLWSPAGLLTVQWFSCLKLFWGLPWYPVQSGLLTQGPYHHSLLMDHVHPQSSIPQLATLTFLHFSLCPSLSCLRAYATTIPTAWNTLSLPMALWYLLSPSFREAFPGHLSQESPSQYSLLFPHGTHHTLKWACNWAFTCLPPLLTTAP